MSKPILVLDFDGVLHSYESGWRGASIVADKPVPGAAQFLRDVVENFKVAIYSARSHQEGGIKAMRKWIEIVLLEAFGQVEGYKLYDQIDFPDHKPPALVTLDDRAITFDGTFPDPKTLLDFKPWNKK